jgi:prepilin-type N-terminal cleavage/methylation domain-containing protein/prepilin-type processing-associated H-X9-DG protein
MTQTQSKPSPAAWRARKGLTLTEILVVILIILVLATIAFSTVTKMRETAKSTVCTGNLRQLGAALIMYYSESNGQPFLINGTMEGAVQPIWPVALAAKGYLSNWDGSNEATKPCGTGVWTCPSCDFMSKNFGGYGVAEGIFKSPANAALSPVRMIHIEEPEKCWLVGDVMQGTDPKKGWYAIWQNPAAWASGHGPAVGRHIPNRANVCMFDGHVEALTIKELKDGKYTYPKK